jgi:predicted 3-demethylubiquinone-9 3-methyltransferase (glyoxalase superfamily)
LRCDRGQPLHCGWLIDEYVVPWQIILRAGSANLRRVYKVEA